MARSRTVERKKEREKAQRRQRQIAIAVAIAVVAVIAIVLIVLVNLPAEAPIPPESAARYEGIPLGATEDGYPRLGERNAPVQVAAYSSFDCTACKQFHDNVLDSIVERVRAGGVSFVHVPLHSTGSVTNGEGAARAALCAAEQDKFWEFHDALFNWQSVYGNQAFTNNRILTGVGNLGLDRGQFDGCIRSDRPDKVIDAAEQDYRGLVNRPGTPTITINGVVPLDDSGAAIPGTNRDAILAAIDQALDIANFGAVEEATSEATAAPETETTAEATEAESKLQEATAEAAQTE